MSKMTASSGDGDASGSNPAGDTARPSIPRTVNLAIAAAVAQVLLMVVHTALLFGFTDDLRRLLVKSNNDLKPTDKNFKTGYTFDSQKVTDDLHTLRQTAVWQAVIIAVALVFLAYSLRRLSSATIARWLIVVVEVITFAPLQVLPAHGWPAPMQVAGVLTGVAAIVLIVALFLPESREYFRAVGELRRGQIAARQGVDPSAPPVRPSLRDMFAPKRPVSLDKGPAARSAAKPASAGSAGSAGSSVRGKSKSRAEADAVARGAALARERAKASKSRRTDAP